MTDEITVSEAVGDDDYALIVSPKGELLGVWVAADADEGDYPPAIVELCWRAFGVDITEDDPAEPSNTLH